MRRRNIDSGRNSMVLFSKSCWGMSLLSSSTRPRLRTRPFFLREMPCQVDPCSILSTRYSQLSVLLFSCSANDRYCHPLPALQLALLPLPSHSNVDERPQPVPSIDRASNHTPPLSISRPPISSKISGNVEVEAPTQSIVCQ